MRFIALVFTAATILVTIIDYMRTMTPEGVMTLRPLGAHWFDLHPGSIQTFQPAVERHVSPALWSGVIQPLLEQPAAIVFGVAALLCFFFSWLIGRNRRRRHAA